MMARRKRKRRKSKGNNPIGYTKKGGYFRLVYGTPKNPRLGTGKWKSKKSFVKAAKRAIKR